MRAATSTAELGFLWDSQAPVEEKNPPQVELRLLQLV